jgi:transcriptional regulator with XRE-family HTH domain
MTESLLAERLRVIRARQGLTVVQAAEKIGIDRHTLRDLELGRRRPNFETMEKVARGYGIALGDLVEEGEPVPLGEALRETGQPRITDLVMDAVRNTDEKDWQAIHRAQESEKLQISIPSVENAAIEHLAERDKGELIDGLFELAKSKLKEEQENARLREALEEVTQLGEADR